MRCLLTGVTLGLVACATPEPALSPGAQMTVDRCETVLRRQAQALRATAVKVIPVKQLADNHVELLVAIDYPTASGTESRTASIDCRADNGSILLGESRP